MAKKYTDEFRRDAVLLEIRSGLTLARQSIRSIDERGHVAWPLFWIKARAIINFYDDCSASSPSTRAQQRF